MAIHIRRRELVVLLGGAVATWPLAARAQQGALVRRVGWLAPLAVDDPQGQVNVAVFQQTLRKLGWIAGRNLSIFRTIAIDFNRSAAEAFLHLWYSCASPFGPAILVTHAPKQTSTQRPASLAAAGYGRIDVFDCLLRRGGHEFLI
ncbi:MAG: hypothetical protein WAV78_23295 [Xanthobacteraceae bacterium]|jgi:hypothetical protein